MSKEIFTNKERSLIRNNIVELLRAGIITEEEMLTSVITTREKLTEYLREDLRKELEHLKYLRDSRNVIEGLINKIEYFKRTNEEHKMVLTDEERKFVMKLMRNLLDPTVIDLLEAGLITLEELTLTYISSTIISIQTEHLEEKPKERIEVIEKLINKIESLGE